MRNINKNIRWKKPHTGHSNVWCVSHNYSHYNLGFFNVLWSKSKSEFLFFFINKNQLQFRAYEHRESTLHQSFKWTKKDQQAMAIFVFSLTMWVSHQRSICTQWSALFFWNRFICEFKNINAYIAVTMTWSYTNWS